MPREDFETSLLADYLRVLTKKSGPLQTSKTVRRSTARTSRSWVDPRGLLTAALKSCLEGQTLPCPLKSNKNEKYWEFLGVEEVEGYFFSFFDPGLFRNPRGPHATISHDYLTYLNRVNEYSQPVHQKGIPWCRWCSWGPLFAVTPRIVAFEGIILEEEIAELLAAQGQENFRRSKDQGDPDSFGLMKACDNHW